ncbi:hypothetical protein DFH09DRAFT_1316478 [Mycena vulgaris]|nr:hypothetical protein DFH09DRAFT_1316478 [Mycena vulgaris]
MLACAATFIPPHPKEARSSTRTDAHEHADPVNFVVWPSLSVASDYSKKEADRALVIVEEGAGVVVGIVEGS